MKLSHRPLTTPSPHKECVVALCWSSSLSEVYSCSNDHSIWRWSRTGKPLSKVYTYQENFTDIHCQPYTAQGQSKAIGSDTFAVSCTNGAFCIVSKGGQDERHIDAHKGAILCLRWNIEGSALATGGQDGFVKVWSRNGMLRSNVFEGENAVFALAWAPESNQLIFSSANNLVIKYVQSSSKHVQWKAHEGLVVKIDWNRTNNLIISVGEEGCYKVWDCFGRLSYISHPYETCPTSIAWCPSGEVFVVGFHNSIILCHKRGWILSKEKFEVAILKTLAWSLDGSQLAVGCTNGTVVFSHVVGRSLEWLHIKASVEDVDHIQIEDFLAGKAKKLDFRDIVINMSLGFGHLIVTTMWQCIIYNVHEWECPHLINIKNISTIMKQCDHCFLIAEFPNEVQIITYDGKKLSDPYFPGLRVDLLNNQNISLSKDMLAVVDSTDNKRLKVLDFITRNEFKDLLHHTEPIVEVGLNQQGTTCDRMIIFLDSNNDLFISPVLKPCITKLAWMTTKAIWNDHADIVVAIVDENLVIWYYPQAIFIDTELLKLLQFKKESFQGKSPDICSSLGRHCTVQYGSGGNVSISLSPVAYLLFDYILQSLWDEAKKLCWRFKEMPLWAILAAAAMHRKMFCVAVEAYAVLGEVDKVNFINHLKAQTSKVVCEAEYALFTRQAKDAELILLNSGLIYRAIKLNIRLFNWDRALELAVMHKKHVDTVLWKRCEYLSSTNQKETKETFQNLLTEVHINVDKIKQMISEEKSAEKNLKEIIV